MDLSKTHPTVTITVRLNTNTSPNLIHCTCYKKRSGEIRGWTYWEEISSWYPRGAGIAQWLQHRTRDRKVAGSSPRRSGGRIFLSRVSLITSISVLPHCYRSSASKSWSFCQRCKWQVTAKHASTLFMWLCMKWRDMVHGCMVYTVRAESAAVSRGSSRVTTKQRCKYTTSVAFQSAQ